MKDISWRDLPKSVLRLESCLTWCLSLSSFFPIKTSGLNVAGFKLCLPLKAAMLTKGGHVEVLILLLRRSSFWNSPSTVVHSRSVTYLIIASGRGGLTRPNMDCFY